jgi:glycine/D-amino acid oxidase-like deaminating enzyme
VSTGRSAYGARPEFAIIGGGLVGWSIAYGLARLGRRVVVHDEGDLALRAARGNFGQVWVQDKGAGVPAYHRLTRESALQWDDLARGLREASGIDVGLRQPGGFSFCLDAAAFDARTRLMRRIQAEAGDHGFEFEMLERGSLERRLSGAPALGRKVVGASYTPYDGDVNPLRLLRALYESAIALGTTHRFGSPVEAIDPVVGGDGFEVRTAWGTAWTPQVVLAAGLGNRLLAPMVGVDCPVRPVRGQVLVTEKVRPLLPFPTADIRQTDEGGLLLGSSQEEAGFDDRVTIGNAGAIARRAVDTFPAIGGLRIVRSWAALRVMTPDGLPVYEASASCPGAWVVSCHSGVTLAAVHVHGVAAAISRGSLPSQYAHCSAARFAGPAQAAGAAASPATAGKEANVPQPA